MNNNNKNSETNFWISYADLMAGLLFVFILLIGAIIVKYSLLQSESKLLEQTLEKEKLVLEKNKKELKQKEEKIKNVVFDLEKTKKILTSVESEYKDAKDSLKKRLLENEKLKISLDEKRSLIENQEKSLEDSKNKILAFTLSEKKLKEKLQNLDDKKRELLSNIEKLDNQIKDKDEKIELFTQQNSSFKSKLKEVELEKNNLVLNLKNIEELSKKKEDEINRLLEDVLLKQNLIEAFKEKNINLEDEIKVIETKLENTAEKHELLSKDLESTKQKIKSFTGIKIKVISLLKNQLGKNIQIDPKNGSLRLSSSILFDEGEYTLKDSSKEALKSTLYDYFQTILENQEINKHIDKIIIEGHTNSVGKYLYNLELSQKRAYSVMDFLLSLDFKNKENLRNLTVASGRSFLDPIYDKKGKEDKEASRRIEIKFNIKNEEAIKEIANLLE